MGVPTPASPVFPSERQLCLRWRNRQYGAQPLVTSTGQIVQVVYPGRWCNTPGPDFRDAILALDNDLRHGDVEAHRRSSGWYAHGHHTVPSYNRVILHIVIEADGPEAVTIVGATVPTLEIPVFDSSPVDVTPVTCPQALDRWEATSLGRLLDAMGVERIRGKSVALEGDMAVQPANQVLYEAICEALGYSRNQKPMRELARRLPLWLLEATTAGCSQGDREVALSAILLGGAGLLPSQRPAGWNPEYDEYLEEAEQTWMPVAAQWDLTPMAHQAWHFGHTRPDNRPTRRVAAVGWLLAHHWEEGLVPSLVNAVEIGPATLEMALCGGEDSAFWGQRLDFGYTRRSSRLIGASRATELAINAVVPFSYALGRKDNIPELCQVALATLRAYPHRGDNEITRYMSYEVLPLSFKSSACRQQGLLHIYRRWCQGKNCLECPVPNGPDGLEGCSALS